MAHPPAKGLKVLVKSQINPSLSINPLMSSHSKETKELLGHILNHDDTIPATQLTKSFDETSAAWKVKLPCNLPLLLLIYLILPSAQAQFGSTYLAKRAFGASAGPEVVDEAAGCGVRTSFLDFLLMKLIHLDPTGWMQRRVWRMRDSTTKLVCTCEPLV